MTLEEGTGGFGGKRGRLIGKKRDKEEEEKR